MIKHYNLIKISQEGVYVNRIYTSNIKNNDISIGSSMIGLYSPYVNSISCFHRLTHDELWHFYGGDPINLYLLYENGETSSIVLGNNFEKGERLTYLVKANTWQGGCTIEGGDYSLFGCTVFPEFTADCFEKGQVSQLINKYPHMEKIINKLDIDN